MSIVMSKAASWQRLCGFGWPGGSESQKKELAFTLERSCSEEMSRSEEKSRLMMAGAAH